ncbi:fimbria/pilus periplasmic chaperone [Vibrio sp. FNV 38]|nr:fimbria/pilus periplasmic chaperone [Vibrio sp. FNV 38]
MRTGLYSLFLILTSFAVSAYEVSPIYQLLESVGAKSQSTYTIKNIEKEEILIEVFAYGMEVINGEELLTPADSEFLILPPQARVKAGGYQKFRIRYLSSEPLGSTEPYRVVFKQIKLNSPNHTASEVEMLVNFSTLAFVSPPKSEAQPLAWINEGEMVIRNEGNRVLDLGKLGFEFETNKGVTSTNWETFSDQVGLYLLPGFNTTLSLSDELKSAKKVELEYRQ